MAKTAVSERGLNAEVSSVAGLPPVLPDAASPGPLVRQYDYQFLDLIMAQTKSGPYCGNVVMVSDELETPGVPAIWYVTRRREGLRWRRWQGWADPVSHNPIGFDPICWRPVADWSDWSKPIR